MYIQKVISYKGAWELANTKFKNQFQEIESLLSRFIQTCEPSIRAYEATKKFDLLLLEKGWKEINRVYVGHIKNGVSADFTIGHSAFLNRWVFQQSVVAMRKGIVELPILIVPCKSNTLFQRMSISLTFENFAAQLEQISPLSHQHRFLILGFSNEMKDSIPEVIELESDALVEAPNEIINRTIEFPPEYHQAGIGILNFFGTYLREQYPNEDVKVKIIQEGLKVRMVIETIEGKSDIVEKALHEYQLIISGQTSPDKISNNNKLVIELKNELRIAQVRIEMQRDIIGLQTHKIDQLFSILENGLNNKQPISIDFNPQISLTNVVNVNNDVILALGAINELKELLPPASEAHTTLKELEGSLEAIEKEMDPEKVKKSGAMSKFKRFIEKVKDGNNDVRNAIDTIEQGWDIVKDLAGKYNSIAQWCGLPQVPTIFTKK